MCVAVCLPSADRQSLSAVFDIQAVAVAQLGLFFNGGQCCIASSRVFVQEGVYDAFVGAS